MSAPLIELAGLDVVHADANDATTGGLARNVSWQIQPGDFWVVGGAPGSGISTLLMTAAGLNRPWQGTLRIFGRRLAEATEADQVEWRRRIGFVFERGGRLLSHLTVAENIALPLRFHTDTPETEVRARVDEWLVRTELTGFAGTMPSRLAPRLQQRAGLARAMIVPSDVLFVDEPPVRISPVEARWWCRELQALHAGGLTLVVGSNDFALWLDTARQFALLHDREFVVIGGPGQVRASREAVWRNFVTMD